MNNDAVKKAEERQRKIIANAEARLKKIAEAAKSDVRAPMKHKSSIDDGFVDFEIDSYVNEPTRASSSTSNVTPACSGKKILNSSAGPGSNSESLSDGESTSNSESNGSINSRELDQLQELLGRVNARDATNHLHRGTFGSSPFQIPVHTNHMMTAGANAQLLSNGRPMNHMNNQDPNNPFNAMPNFAGMSQNPADLSNLLNALSGLASGGIPQAPQATQEETHPVVKPVLNIVVFLALGVITRIFFQISTLNVNVFAPFLCLAVPLAIMSWGKRPQPLTGLLSAVLLFVRNPRTQTMIVSWVRLTTLLRGLSRLFACYFFAFVATHVVCEFSSITLDIDSHSTESPPLV